MASFELENDSFYICTELAPRCYIVQKAIQIDRGQLERMMGEKETKRDRERQHMMSETNEHHTHAPPPPILPYWFTQDCRRDLLLYSPPNSYTPSPSPIPQAPDLKTQLRLQLEYYFSRENLIQDRYLRCQMDTDQWVSIAIIAGFRKIVQLTTDYSLILQVLRESSMVEVDEKGEKVRPVSRRCTIILREVAEDQAFAVEEMLGGGPSYVSLRYGLNNSWYVTYNTEEETQEAYLHLQNSGASINGKPVCARIKTGGPPSSELYPERSTSSVPPMAPSPTNDLPVTTAQTPSTCSSNPAPPPAQYTHLYDLGSVLAAHGFVPRATYRPGQTVVHVTSDSGVSSGLGGGNGLMGAQPITSTLTTPYMTQPALSTTPPLFREFIPNSSSPTLRGASRMTSGTGKHRGNSSPRDQRFSHTNQPSTYTPTNSFYSNGLYPNGEPKRGRGGARGNGATRGTRATFVSSEKRRGDRSDQRYFEGTPKMTRRLNEGFLQKQEYGMSTQYDGRKTPGGQDRNDGMMSSGLNGYPHSSKHLKENGHQPQTIPSILPPRVTIGGVIPPTPTTLIPSPFKRNPTINNNNAENEARVLQLQNSSNATDDDGGWNAGTRTRIDKNEERNEQQRSTRDNNNAHSYFSERQFPSVSTSIATPTSGSTTAGSLGTRRERSQMSQAKPATKPTTKSTTNPTTRQASESEKSRTISFIASGRRKERPPEKKSYAAMLKVASIPPNKS
ncbi:unnamed protein product, partial [Mesorhabditis belari]|uniref:HTH La-type RNA-binding domain-containing protein n=1 Tax=Mesorhabditis belari TaxID=2138241 RepID=A0AAF3F3G7_9BILA